jgi:hypothetical protein
MMCEQVISGDANLSDNRNTDRTGGIGGELLCLGESSCWGERVEFVREGQGEKKGQGRRGRRRD